MRILLAGLWARRGINAAALLVIWVAVTAAVLGPMYGRMSSEHLVDTRLDGRAPYTTGMSFSVEALDELPDDPDAYVPPEPQSLVDEASATVAAQDPGRFWPEETGWLLDRGGTMKYGATTFQVPLYWRDGHVRPGRRRQAAARPHPTRCWCSDVMARTTRRRRRGHLRR